MLDTSITMAWCFEDEANDLGEAILNRLTRDPAVVPTLWRYEVANVLVVAERRGRLTESQAARFLALLRRLPIRVEDTAPESTTLQAVAVRHGLTAYDAAYLELAQRKGLGVATQAVFALGGAARPVGASGERGTWDGVGVLAIVAVVTSIIAVLTSAGIALRAVKLSRNANHLPVIISFLSIHRSPEFMKHEEEIWNHLHEHDPNLGFAGLPELVKAYAIEVALFYQAVAYIVLDGLVDWRTLVVQVHYRSTKTWNVMHPHVKGERALRGGEYTFLNTLEMFISMTENLDQRELSARKPRRFR